jgi:hypothetical protein
MFKVKDLPIINIIYEKNDKSVMMKCETTRKYFFFRNILSIFFKFMDRLFEIPQKHIKFY